MGVKKYLLRVLRYLLRMVLLLGLIFALMLLTKTSEVGAAELWAQMMNTQKGAILIIALVGVALMYPKFGYVERAVMLDMVDNRDTILEVMRKMGYTIVSEKENKMVFQSSGLLKKIMLMGDDKITMNSYTKGVVVLDGVRKDVVVAEFRMNSFVESK